MSLAANVVSGGCIAIVREVVAKASLPGHDDRKCYDSVVHVS